MKYLRAIIIQFIIIALGIWFCSYFCHEEIESLFSEDAPNFLCTLGIFWVLSSFVQLSTSWDVWIVNISVGIVMFLLGAFTTIEGFFVALFAVAVFIAFEAYLVSAFDTRLSGILMIIAIITGGIGWKFRDCTEPTDEKARIEKRKDKEFKSAHVKNEHGLWYDKKSVIIIKHKVYRKGFDIIENPEVEGKWEIVPDGYSAIKYCGKWHAIPDDQHEIYDDNGNLLARKGYGDGIWWTPDGGLYDGGWNDYDVSDGNNSHTNVEEVVL